MTMRSRSPVDRPGQPPQRERLQKVLAAVGVASRRDCEQLILDGRVSVNGRTVTRLPVFVQPGHDDIDVDGRRLPWPDGDGRPAVATGRRLYILLNKPRGVISTTDDPQGRPTVLDLLPKGYFRGRGRVYPVGRLDADSTGLILLTNDGALANRLTHPRYEIPKQYLVSVRGYVTAQDLRRLREGLFLARDRGSARKARMAQVSILKHEQDRQRGDRTQLAVTLRQGQNRQIRRMLERLGHKVRRLERIALGPLRLRGLARREWRHLTLAEVRDLLRATEATPHD